jgi:ribokinase
MAQPRVCVLGSLNMDITVRTERLPMPGETVLGRGYSATPGGKGANQALAAARLGASVRLIGAVGDDAHGAKLRAVLAAEGVDLTHVRVQPPAPEGQPTGLGLITVAEGASGENTIVVAPGANAAVRPEDVRAAAEAITESDCLLVQLELPMATVVEAARIAAGAPAGRRPVLLNASPARPLPLELLKLVDVIIVNRAEAQVLTSMDAHTDPARLAFRVAEFGPPTVVLTLGSQGSVLCHRGRPRRVPTIRVQAVDTVGAGDAFAGALAAGWPPVHAAAMARSPDEFRLLDAALLRASVAGALATTRRGAIPAMPTASEIEARMGEAAAAS